MIPVLQTRNPDREFLDQPELDPAELRRNLREMAMLNRLPGGVDASRRAIERQLADLDSAVVLDVGTGSGDLPAALLRRAHGRQLHVLACDQRPEILERAGHRLLGLRQIQLLQANATRLPLADESVDVAHASLLVHHLDPPEAIQAMGEMRRVSRRGVVINDLRRGAFAFAITAITVLGLARGRYTRHDGVLSARRAYTLAELDDLASSAGLRLLRRSPAFLPRVVTEYR